MEQMKRISAKYESEWMNKPLNSNLHPIFQILQSKDPLSDLEKFLSENDIRLVFVISRSDWSPNRLLREIFSVNEWKSQFCEQVWKPIKVKPKPKKMKLLFIVYFAQIQNAQIIQKLLNLSCCWWDNLTYRNQQQTFGGVLSWII